MTELQHLSEVAQAYQQASKDTAILYGWILLLLFLSSFAIELYVRLMFARIDDAQQAEYGIPRWRWLRRYVLAQRIRSIRRRKQAERVAGHLRRVALQAPISRRGYSHGLVVKVFILGCMVVFLAVRFAEWVAG
jgi:hypothetical protein